MEDTEKKGNRVFCEVCGVVDEYYDENAVVFHDDTPKHLCNVILSNYKSNKKSFFSKNRDGISILGSVQSQAMGDAIINKDENSDNLKIIITVKPKQTARFSFSMANELRNEDVFVVGIQLAHPQPQFETNNHPYEFGGEPKILAKKSSVSEAVVVDFISADIGQYEMPIIFTFFKPSNELNLIFIREMVVYVVENPVSYVPTKSPYNNERWEKPAHFIKSTNVTIDQMFKVPKLLKPLFARGLREDALEDLHCREQRDQLRVVLIDTRAILDEGITKENYMIYFHHLLWWEEVIQKINLRKYNMTGVKLERVGEFYMLEVPGLAEKRPSLLRGDRVVLRPVENKTVHFESYIKSLEDCTVQLAGFDESFHSYYSPEAEYDVRFLMSRVPLERTHEAVSKLHSSKLVCRVFPAPNDKPAKLKTIDRFYNQLIKGNSEQRSAVQHIVSGSAGRAPYIVFGPPGTGKTMTIVEAIIQLAVSNPRHRVMVCTDSNMAADHIAVALLHYKKVLNISNYLLRANSQSREWTVMPPALAPVSNGTSYENFYPVTNVQLASYRIVVTTLLHAAKYASARNQSSHKVQMSHLFIDEAAQASEPAALVPAALLAPRGRLVLAGDPQQLGPVCISREAHHRGLGTSLLERLHSTYGNLYSGDSNYITMLIKNFRSDPDILQIPNHLFYKDNLQALAKPDPLSRASVLGAGGGRAVVFHAVHSVEQRMGKSPSYFNERELDMVKRYINALVTTHDVQPEDIGVIAPYIRQVYKVKSWLTSKKYDKIEVGTVESFQGKEKRVIIVSTVRANCKLLDYDAKYSLGFLVDDKRFNVTLTRAKAKLIIIGNPACLNRDRKWREYMELCRQYECYFGQETQQLERTSALHQEVNSRLKKSRVVDALKKIEVDNKNKNKNKNNKK